MWAAYPGDIVFSKIDARSGAIGMLPPEIAKAVVTTEYPVFTGDPERLEGEFVKMVLRTGGFMKALRRRASGTSGRKRITPEVFQDLRIPLPPLDQQRTMISAHRAVLDHAAQLERLAHETQVRAMAAFEAALGLEAPAPLPDRPVLAASFKNLHRWSHEAVLRRTVEGDTTRVSPYPVFTLADVIADLTVGWSPRCLNRPANDDEWGVLKLSAVTSGYFKPSENKALPPNIGPKAELAVKRGDVLIARGSGRTQLVGTSVFVAEEPMSNMMICGLIFRVNFKQESDIEPAFLAAVLATSRLRYQIEERRTGAAPMMQKITRTALMSLCLPLPPTKEKQAEILRALADARANAADLRKQAEDIRAKAWADFEAAVYVT